MRKIMVLDNEALDVLDTSRYLIRVKSMRWTPETRIVQIEGSLATIWKVMREIKSFHVDNVIALGGVR